MESTLTILDDIWEFEVSKHITVGGCAKLSMTNKKYYNLAMKIILKILTSDISGEDLVTYYTYITDGESIGIKNIFVLDLYSKTRLNVFLRNKDKDTRFMENMDLFLNVKSQEIIYPFSNIPNPDTGIIEKISPIIILRNKEEKIKKIYDLFGFVY